MPPNINILTTVDAVLELEADWQRLLEATGNDALHMSWPWVSTWLDIYGRDSRVRPAVIVVRNNGAIQGIAPLMIVRKRSRLGFPYRELRFLCEGGEISFDYMDFLQSPESPQNVHELLIQSIWDLQFDTLALCKTRNRDLPGALGGGGPQSAGVSPVASLGEDWESYLAGRSSKFRSNLKRYQRKCERHGEISYLRVPDDINFEDGFKHLVALNRERWGEEGDSFRTSQYGRFQRRVASDALSEGRLWLRFLSVGDQIAAAKYNIVYAGRMYSLQAGRLPQFSKCGIGHLLNSYIFQEAISNGIHAVDFLPGTGYHKEAWADDEVPLFQSRGRSSTIRGMALRLEGSIKKAYRRLKKRQT